MKIKMKRTAFALFALLMLNTGILSAQEKSERASPMRSASAEVNEGEVLINYSAPLVKGRALWGDLVPYDKVWRTGANEATTITFEKDVKIDGQTVKAGKYGLFTIPGKGEWTVVINSVWDQWGAYNYDKGKDVVRFTATPKMADDVQEELKFTVENSGMVTMAWDKLRLGFRVE